MSYTYQLAEDELTTIFEEQIAAVALAEINPSASPELVVLGGQPASGKTRSRHLVMADERFSGVSFFAPEGDALRVWHPDYDRAVSEDPLLMPEVTKQASGAWLKSSIELGFAQGASMLIEGTWRAQDVPLNTVAQAQELGYRTHAVLVAVPPEVSRVEMLARFYEPTLHGQPARWTPPAAHDEAVANLERTASALARSSSVATFSVITRDALFIVDQELPGPQRAANVREGLERARAAFWTPASRSEWLDRVDTYHEAHQHLTSQAPEAIAVWEQVLNRDVPAVERMYPLPPAPDASGVARRFDLALEKLRAHEGSPRAPSRSEQERRRESPPRQQPQTPDLR